MKRSCKRLQKEVTDTTCHACLRDCSFRRALVKQAEANEIYWEEQPCQYEVEAGVPEEVSVDNNHWYHLDPIAPPSIRQRAKNLTASGKRVVGGLIRGKAVKTTKQVQKTRLKICESCALFDPKTKVCGECGCFMEVKVGLAVERCPLGKWKAL
jgi:hypothetical protein